MQEYKDSKLREKTCLCVIEHVVYYVTQYVNL